MSDLDFATFVPCVEIVTLTKYASVHLVLTENAALFSSLLLLLYIILIVIIITIVMCNTLPLRGIRTLAQLNIRSRNDALVNVQFTV